jgi:hypothetical protein
VLSPDPVRLVVKANLPEIIDRIRLNQMSPESKAMRVDVQCYAGRKADERPVSFLFGARKYMVDEVLDQWYGPDDNFYKVCADDGNLYILRHRVATDEWILESFREVRSTRKR